jgi:hypothetical protein
VEDASNKGCSTQQQSSAASSCCCQRNCIQRACIHTQTQSNADVGSEAGGGPPGMAPSYGSNNITCSGPAHLQLPLHIIGACLLVPSD